MSVFKVNVIAVNPKREELTTSPLEALVDTGSELTWLPSDALRQIGVTPRRERSFTTATKQIVKRQVGYAILRSEGYETTDEIVFAEAGDMTLLGVRTLEGFGVAVDNIGHRFVAQTTIVAIVGHAPPPDVLTSLPSAPQIQRRAQEAMAKAPVWLSTVVAETDQLNISDT